MANNLSANDFQLGVQVVPKTDQLNNEFKKISQTATLNVNVKINDQSFKKVNKVVETYSNNLGKTYQQTTILNQANEVLYSSTTKLNEKFKPFNKEVKQSSQNLSETAKTAKQASGSITNLGEVTSKAGTQAKSLGQSFGDIVTKVGKFYLATKPIQMMQQAFDEALQSVKDFDDAMTDLRKVSDLDGEALTDYTIKLGELGEAVYRSRTEMTEAAVLFKQTGASDEDAAKLAQLANLYMNVADNEMTAADASSYITSQMKAFKITANDAITILDKTNEVSNQFAVSSSDISRALTTSSSSLAVYGNDINETIALVTAGAEIMTGKSRQVGRGLRSIGANISALASSAGELKFQVNGATETISLIDKETGDMVNTFQALSEIHKYWDKMTASEKAALATTLAGKTQLDVFSSVLSNFNTAIEANTVAVESNGSAWEENNKRADSISAKLNLLKSQFQELVLGKGGLQEFAKNLLDVGIAMLKFANSDVGQAIIKIASLTAGIALLNKTWTSLQTISKTNILASAITSLIAGETTLGQVTGVLTTKFLANAKAWAATPFGMVTIAVGAVVAIKAAYDHFNVTLEEHVEKLKELKSDYEEAQTKADELEKQLDNVRDRIEEINSKDNLEITDETQLRMLQEEEASLENQLIIQKELARIAKEEATNEAKKTLQKQFKDEEAFGTTTISSGGIDVQDVNEGTATEALDIYVKRLNETQDEIDSLLIKKAELEKSNKTESEEYKQINADIDALRTKKAELRETTASYAETVSLATQGVNEEDEVIQSATASLTSYTETLQRLDGEDASGNADKTADSVQKVADAADNANDNLGETDDYLSDLAKSAGVSVDELQNFADTMGLAVESAAEILPRFNEWNETVDDIQSAYETLTQAVEEYNEQGGYTTDTLQQLLALDPAYLAALQEENGQLTINKQMLMTKVQAQAAEAKQIIYNTAIEKLNAIASGEAGNATATAGQQHNDAVAGIDAETGSLNENTKAKLANAVAEARGRGGGAAEGEINKILSEMNDQLEAVDNWVNTTAKDFSKGMGKAASSTNKATKAVKEQKSAVEQLKEKYGAVIDFIIKQYDKKIDAVKKAKDEAVSAVEKQIKALEKEKDAAIKAVEAQIKSLEKERDARLKAIDDEITSLQRQRDARAKYWEEQLDKLEKENKERERNIALQKEQQALALAQQTNVMVLQDGQFQYTQDESAVAGAEQDLAEQEDQNEYERQKELIEELRDTELEWYDERIQALEDYKEQVEEYYEEQIEKLEEHKEYLEEYYDEQIEALEEYKEQLEEQYDAQIEMLENERERVKEILEGEAEDQQASWETMLTQLAAFVEEWNAKVGEMKFPSLGGIGVSVGGKGAVKAKSTGDNKVSAYASGKGSIGDSEIAVVGENPKYRELVIGSKLNNDQGVVMNLKRGSGVVNAGATNTLASIFNSLNGQKSVGQPVSNSSQSMSIQIGSISLPEVKDGQGFVDYLQNFSADITQQSYTRK